jgi:beta-glucosidase
VPDDAAAPTTSRPFPDGFTWGTATAAHQVEGGNWNNDWWAWEHAEGTPCVEPSGDACDHFWRYPQDIALLAELGFDNYRFSLEWSRIEPEDGEISKAALDHYRRMVDTCHEHGLRAVVTYHHFTSPRWITALGGWEEPVVADRFGRFAQVVTEALGDEIDSVCTINEPNIVATVGWLLGAFPPGKQLDIDGRRRVNDVMVAAHRKAVEAVRDVNPNLPVGLTLSMADYQAVPADDGDAVAKRDQIRRSMEDVFLDATEGDDFLGVQTYSRERVGPDGNIGPEQGERVLDMGYEFWPEALEATIRRAWTYTKGEVPLIVTENGIGTTKDAERVEYVQRALEGVLRCLDDGIDVRGYTYWSLLDNFEWAFGYVPQFGIVSVDRETQERTLKPSAQWLGQIARANALPVA